MESTYLLRPLPLSSVGAVPACRRQITVRAHLQRHRELGVRLADVAEVDAGLALKIWNKVNLIYFNFNFGAKTPCVPVLCLPVYTMEGARVGSSRRDKVWLTRQ